ncbi:MAG: PAS domain S-box protein [Betaproteobacteria bacterium]
MTEQKPREALSNAGRLLRSLTDASLDAIYIKDRESRWLFANPALERIAGKPLRELLGKTDAEIYFNPEVGQLILANDKRIIESGKPETVEEFVDLADGRHFFISVKSPRFDDKGNVTGIVGISHDITNRKRREEELKASQKKYKDLIETTNDFVWEMDPNGRYTYCSPQMEKLWKINPREMIGKTPFDQMPSVKGEEGLRLFQSLVTSKECFSEVQVPSLDGKGNLIFIEISGIPFFDDKGELLGYRGVTRDITERKKAEEALRQSEAKFKSLAENAPDAIMRFDRNLRALYLNPKDLAATGKSLDEFIGKTNEEMGMPAELCRLWNKLFDEAKTSRQVQQMEFDFDTPDGIRTFSLRVVPEFSEDGSLISYIGISRDVTERKQMAKKLEEYTKNLESLVEERTKELKTGALYARGLIEASLDPLITIDAEGKISDVNKATETVTDCSREELIGSDFSDYFTQPEKARRGYLQVFRKGYVRDYPLSIRSKSGKIVEVLYNATLFRNEEGKVEGIFAAARDMTEHKKAEKSLLNERKRLFDVLETLPAMVCLLTRDHYVDFANRSFRHRFGESEGRHCYDYCFGNKEPCSFCESYTPLKTGKPHHWELKAPDGSVIDAHDFPFTDVDGTRKILEMDIDITERKRMEKQLKDSERLAAIGATAGMVGHDIRNPLQAIIMDVFWAKGELDSLPESNGKKNVIESLDEIEKNIDYINKIVQDLQDYARPLNPKVEESDIKEIVDTVIKKSSPIPATIK